MEKIKEKMFQVEPIGYFHTVEKEKYELPSQPNSTFPNEGYILLNPKVNFEQALEGLGGFDRIWLIFWFHNHTNWKTKVLPPRGGKKQGVFATRSPHRPNFIGLSCVELRAIEGLKLHILNHDLLDGTPILDIKPYLNYADSIPAKRQGWLEELPEVVSYQFGWSELARNQCDYLAKNWNIHLKEIVEKRLTMSPLPYKNNRIKERAGYYELAYKEWRIFFTINGPNIHILEIKSGYSLDRLNDEKLFIHRQFSMHFIYIEKGF